MSGKRILPTFLTGGASTGIAKSPKKEKKPSARKAEKKEAPPPPSSSSSSSSPQKKTAQKEAKSNGKAEEADKEQKRKPDPAEEDEEYESESEFASGSSSQRLNLAPLWCTFVDGSTTIIQQLYLGVYDETTLTWKSCCMCASSPQNNMLFDMLDAQTWIQVSKDSSKVPSWLDLEASASIIPDAVVRDPRNSVSMEVAFDAVKPGTNFSSGYVLTNARLTGDVGVGAAADLDKIQELATGRKPVSGTPTASAKKNKHLSRTKSTSDDLRPLCKYGAKCYRTDNAEHLAEFLHPHLGMKSDDYDPDFVTDDVVSDEEDRAAVTRENIVRGKRQRKRVDYAGLDSPESEEDENDEESKKDTDEKDEEENEEDAWGLPVSQAKQKRKRLKRAASDESFRDEDAQVADDASVSDANETNEDADETAVPNENQKQKLPCPYGDDCYRKNPAHLEEFSHLKRVDSKSQVTKTEERVLPKSSASTSESLPRSQPVAEVKNDWNIDDSWSASSSNQKKLSDEKNSSKEASSVNNPAHDLGLSDIFSGLSCALDEVISPAKRANLKRLFIAFDGDVVNSPTSDTMYFITEQVTDSISNLLAKYSNMTPVKPEWILDSAKGKKKTAR